MSEKTLYVVGIGPGEYEQMTIKAVNALNRSQVLIGYTLYVELVKTHFPGKECIATPMTEEVKRCRMALDKANEGRVVSMVCSGDAGIYGMAGPILEMALQYPEVSVEVVPGVTAASAGAAILGAPVCHDFAVISLSDRLTPKEQIERRLECAAMSDMVICIYNPSSRHRKDYLRWACEVVARYQGPDTVCGLVRKIGREGQAMKIMTLEELTQTEVDMFTTVYMGSSKTIVRDGRMITPRGYRYG